MPARSTQALDDVRRAMFHHKPPTTPAFVQRMLLTRRGLAMLLAALAAFGLLCALTLGSGLFMMLGGSGLSGSDRFAVSATAAALAYLFYLRGTLAQCRLELGRLRQRT